MDTRLEGYLDEGGELGFGQAASDSVQELGENGRNKVTTLLDQLRDQVTDKQSSRFGLRRVQELGDELDSELQSSLSTCNIAPN